eukprot:g17585.t1
MLSHFACFRGSGGVFAVEFRPTKSAGESTGAAAACDRELLALLFPEAYPVSDGAKEQDVAQREAAFGSLYVSIPFSSVKLRKALECYSSSPTYMWPNASGDFNAMPKNRDQFFEWMRKALEQPTQIQTFEAPPTSAEQERTAPSGASATPEESFATRTPTVQDATGLQHSQPEKEMFLFVPVKEMVRGLRKKVTEAVQWAAAGGASSSLGGSGSAGAGGDGATQPDVVNVVYQIFVEPSVYGTAGAGYGVRYAGCESEALTELMRGRSDVDVDIDSDIVDDAQQIICKSDLWALVQLWHHHPDLFEDHGGVGKTTWRLDGWEAAASFAAALAVPRWDDKPGHLRPKAALVVGSLLPNVAKEMPQKVADSRKQFEVTSITDYKVLAYDRFQVDTDKDKTPSTERTPLDETPSEYKFILPEWRLFGNFLNEGETGSAFAKNVHNGIKMLLKDAKQGIPYKQSHNLHLVAPTGKKLLAAAEPELSNGLRPRNGAKENGSEAGHSGGEGRADSAEVLGFLDPSSRMSVDGDGDGRAEPPSDSHRQESETHRLASSSVKM